MASSSFLFGPVRTERKRVSRSQYADYRAIVQGSVALHQIRGMFDGNEKPPRAGGLDAAGGFGGFGCFGCGGGLGSFGCGCGLGCSTQPRLKRNSPAHSMKQTDG